MERQYKKLIIFLILFCLPFTFVSQPSEAALLFDRGLPVYNAIQPNINDAAGANRSNTSPVVPYLGRPEYYVNPGDDFTIGTPGTYHLDTLRLWGLSGSDMIPLIAPSLWMGPEGGPLQKVSTTFVYQTVTYSNLENFQYPGTKSFRNINQVDWALNINVQGGQTYQFFLEGLWWKPGTLLVFSPSLHASNAALSNAPQEGADDIFLFQVMHNGVSTDVVLQKNFFADIGKPADANVQVFGSVVPLPSALLLLGSGLACLVGWRCKRN
jgi:hypothetical protein